MHTKLNYYLAFVAKYFVVFFGIYSEKISYQFSYH